VKRPEGQQDPRSVDQGTEAAEGVELKILE